MKNVRIVTDDNIVVDKRILHNLIQDLKNSEKFTIESLQINILNSEYVLELNRKYLNHDYKTDIITFNYSGSHDNLEGEIFISFQDALGNAMKFNVNLDTELLRLIIHGILHMIGFDDMNEDDKKLMKNKENRLVGTFQSKYENIIIKYDC